MNLNNLATLFGPNLLRPGSNQAAAAFDVMSPVNILMFVLTCPIEFYDEPSFGGTHNSNNQKHALDSPLYVSSHTDVGIIDHTHKGNPLEHMDTVLSGF